MPVYKFSGKERKYLEGYLKKEINKIILEFADLLFMTTRVTYSMGTLKEM